MLQESGPLDLYFPRESLKLHSRTESSSKAAFLDHSETLWMRSAAAWWATCTQTDVPQPCLGWADVHPTQIETDDLKSQLMLKTASFVSGIDVDFVALHVQIVICVVLICFLKFCLRRDGGFTGLLNEIANSDAEGMWDILCYTHKPLMSYIGNVRIKINSVGFCFSTKVAFCRFRLDDGAAPKDILFS